jgi:hypothetical protein
MHLYFGTRGVNHQIELWKIFMQSQMFPFTRKNLDTGKEEVIYVQGALRPVQLWEYVIPEECLEEVLSNMGMNDHISNNPPAIKKAAQIMRKMIGLKEIPTVESKIHDRMMQVFGVAVHPIGIKYEEKKEIDFGKEGRFFQEPL